MACAACVGLHIVFKVTYPKYYNTVNDLFSTLIWAPKELLVSVRESYHGFKRELCHDAHCTIMAINTPKSVCQSISQVFRVLKMYNFDCVLAN